MSSAASPRDLLPIQLQRTDEGPGPHEIGATLRGWVKGRDEMSLQNVCLEEIAVESSVQQAVVADSTSTFERAASADDHPSYEGERILVQGVPFKPSTISSFLTWLDSVVRDRRGAYVCQVNASSVVQASRDPAFMRALRHADVCLPDGAPIAWAVSWLTRSPQSRLAGPDVMLEVLRHARERGYRVLLYGSTDETLERLRKRLRAAYPGLLLVDAISPPFRALTAAEEVVMCHRLRRARPDLVLVGLGAPKQELWMQAHRKELGALLLGVGAAFDFHSGQVRRAPRLLQRVGLEWAHRLIQEPRRLWKRYATTLPVFAWRLLKQVVWVYVSGQWTR